MFIYIQNYTLTENEFSNQKAQRFFPRFLIVHEVTV